MLTHERTVNIGIETAANALRKFLISGDSPADCTAILSTINSELQTMTSSQTVQSIVQSFLESDLLSSACEVWNHDKIPESLEIEISSLFHLVTQSIFEGTGDLTSGLQYRDSHTNKLVCSFYHRLYKAALESAEPRLAKEINIAISDKLVGSLAANPSFVMSFFDHHGEFLPYSFLVKHIPRFFEQVARCLTSCKDDRYLQSHIKEHLAVLVRRVTWGEIVSLWDQENSWKLLFFCEVLHGSPINESALLVFESFLHSIDSWKVLFEVCLYFLNMVAHNASIDSIIAESADTRMVLVMRNAVKEPLTEQEELIVWDFICKALESNSSHLILGLFYDERIARDAASSNHILRSFRRNTFKLMASDIWFVETFTNCFPDFCRMAILARNFDHEFSVKKSLSCFFVSGITNFLTNSLITNRFIYSVTIHLLTFDCSESIFYPYSLADKIATLLESVDATKFKEAKQSVSEPDGASRNLKAHLQMPTTDESIEERPLSEFERLSFRSEGMRQNFFLLEAIVATLYAAIKAKTISMSQTEETQEKKWRGRLRDHVYCENSSENGDSSLDRAVEDLAM